MKTKIERLELPSSLKGLCDTLGQIVGPFKDFCIERKKPKPKVFTREVSMKTKIEHVELPSSLKGLCDTLAQKL